VIDPGPVVDFALLPHRQSVRGNELDPPEKPPADGVVTGHGLVDGRQVWVIAYDFTVMAGSMGAVGESFKTTRVRELALRYRKPIVCLLGWAGARIREGAGSPVPGRGRLFHDRVHVWGWA